VVSDMTEDELRHVIAKLHDAHVIADTFRACALRANPLQRGEDPDPPSRPPEF
jgi:hypothetical protein